MTWLLWRQHRMQAAIAAGLLGAFGIVLWITGLSLEHTYRTVLAACGQPGADCSAVSLFHGDGFLVTLVNLTVAVPILIGAFWGTTAVGREYDAGTNLLVWTQSVPRRRWLRAKVLTLGMSSLVAGAALSGMVTWWSRPQNSAKQSRFEPLQFDIQGLMPAAFTLFAAALGLAAGVVWRRALPAIATTVAGYVAVRLPIETWLRPNIFKPVTVVNPMYRSGDQPPGAWSLHTDLVHNGVVVTGPVRAPTDCAAAAARASMNVCMNRHGYHLSATFQPGNRYWTFQWIEAGIFVGISALLIGVAIVVVRRRDA